MAARLFHANGYHGVALADVAAELGMTAPALYRHFRGKQALLAGAISVGLDDVEAVLADSAQRPFDELLSGLAAAALRHRELWVLLQRDLRLLDSDNRRPVEEQFARMVAAFSDRLVQERPDLEAGDRGPVVAGVLAALSAPSLHRHSLTPTDYQRELAEIGRAVALTRLPVGETGVTPRKLPRTGGVPRGEQLLDTAIDLFAARGYSAVSLDDIGAEIGIAGPSIYHHYATKADILVAAFSRATERLSVTDSTNHTEDTERTGETGGGDPRRRMAVLVDRYTALALANRELFAVYVNDAINLPRPDARRIAATLDADVDLWVSTLLTARPDLAEPAARLRVNAARGIVNDLVRLGRLASRPRIGAEIGALAGSALGVDPPSADGPVSQVVSPSPSR